MPSTQPRISSQILVHFDPAISVLECDASQYGGVAVVSHKYANGDEPMPPVHLVQPRKTIVKYIKMPLPSSLA